MKIVVVYVYPPSIYPKYEENAIRFLESYHQCPAGIEHEVHVVVNGQTVKSETRCLFSSLQNCRFIEHDNSGYDIGAFQKASHSSICDLMVFFGSSGYVRGPGWLKRMAEAFQKRGNALYGSMGNLGDPNVNVYPHVRTTGFWLSPTLFNAHPMVVRTAKQRYPYEHGPDCLTEWVRKQGLKVWIVTWGGEYEIPYWDSIPNGFHRGNQSELLTGDRVTDPPFYHSP